MNRLTPKRWLRLATAAAVLLAMAITQTAHAESGCHRTGANVPGTGQNDPPRK